MVSETSFDISRRQFLAAGGLTVAAACFAPSYLIAQTGGIVRRSVQGSRNSKGHGSKPSPQYQRPFGRWWKYRRSHRP